MAFPDDSEIVFYDLFEDESLDTDKWDINAVNTITYSLSESLYITDATKSTNTYWIYNNSDTGSQHQAKLTIPSSEFQIQWKSKLSDTVAKQMSQVGVGLIKSDDTIILWGGYSDDQSAGLSPKIRFMSESIWSNVASGWTGSGTNNLTKSVNGDNESIFKIIKNGTTVSVYVDGIKIGDTTISTIVSNIGLVAGAYGGYSFFNYVKFTYLIVTSPPIDYDIEHTSSSFAALIRMNEEDYVDWLWQNEVEITGSASGQLVNYPVLITVPYSSEFMRYDFGDIRFGTDYGLNLPYFLRQKVDGDFAEFFVKIPVIPTSPTITTIYLYAGNEQAQDKSNGFNVFDLFDDFNEDYIVGIDTSKWTTSGTYPPTIVDGELYINTGIPSLHSRLTSITTFGENYALGIKAKVPQSGGNNSYVSFGFDDGSTRYIKQHIDENSSSFNVNDSGTEDTGDDVDSTYDPSEYHVYEMIHKQSVNISENIDFTPVDSSIAIISTAVPVKIHAYGYGAYQYAWVDYVYVRKAIANEPAIGELGTWSTTQHSDIYKATLEIPFWEDYQALMCIRPLREDFQALLNITGYAEPEIQALINILPIIAQNYTGLYQASLEINADAGSKDVQSLINIGSVVDGSMEIYGKILYNYNKSAINTETSTGLSSDDSNVQFVINLGGRIYG